MKRKVKNRFVFFDCKDKKLFEKHTWWLVYKSKTAYLCTDFYSDGVNKRKYFHRLVMGEPENKLVDHIDSNGLNNRRKNLRIVTHQQNIFNMNKKKRGVSFDKSRKQWQAKIQFNYKTINLGRFKLQRDAYAAYDVASALFFKEHGKLNNR